MFLPPNSLIFDIALATLTTFSISIIGVASLIFFARRVRFSGLELFTYGVAFGVVIHAAIGLLVGNFPFNKQIIAIAFLLIMNSVGLLYWRKRKIFAKLREAFTIGPIAAILCWLIISIICITISNINIKFPDNLFDGPYVIKNHNLHVKIQTITGHLPADNFIPYLVSEFFLRDISFQDERPIMPGQEIANRPILMALVTIPFRAAFDPPPLQSRPLPRFQYLGSWWPDVGALGEDRYFRQFLVVGIILNAMFILAATLFIKSFGLNNKYAIVGLLLLMLNPYFISQVLFTWPKLMAAFFVLLSIHTLKVRSWPAIAGLITSLAYLSHPYAIVFAGSFTLYLAVQHRKKKLPIRLAFYYSMAFVIGVSPWFIWTKIILKIPSDLVSQNLFTGLSFANLIWVRVYNIYVTIFPGFFGYYPFNGDKLLQASFYSVPGIIGLLFFSQAYLACKQYCTDYRFLIKYGILIPGLLLILIFSVPAVPGLHGFQAIAPMLILLSVKWMQDHASMRILLLLLVLQLTINAAMFSARATTLEVGLNYHKTSTETLPITQNLPISKNADSVIALCEWSSIEKVNAKVAPNIGVQVSVNGIDKKSIWINPPTSLVFRGVLIGDSPWFKASISIHPSVWKEMDADGATFRVAVLSDNKEEVLFEKEINPYANSNEKKWSDIHVDLGRFANQRIDLILSVYAGPKDNDYADWCIWGEPLVTFDRARK